MTSTAYSLEALESLHTRVRLVPRFESAVTDEDRLSSERPWTIPASQLYYWTDEWQNGEAEALAEIERGEALVFDNGQEAVEWLHSLVD